MCIDLKDKITVIMGGSVGFGLTVADALTKEGVHLTWWRGKDWIKHMAAGQVSEYGVRVVGICADVAKAENVEAVLSEVDKAFGGSDILINNAGTGSNETILEANDEKWPYYWNLQVMAAVRLCRGLAPLMQKRGGGVIINNASICPKQPYFF